MAQYSYRALNDTGRTIRGKLSANNETDLYQQLQQSGLMLLDSKTVKESAVTSAMSRGISAREKIQFFVHLEQLQAAGVPVEGMGILLGVDTIPDMFRTTTNVTADMAAAVTLSRGERAAIARPNDGALG